MSTTADTVERVRSDARKLHQTIAEAFAKNEPALRKDLQEARGQAEQLAVSLRALAKERASEAAAYFANAAASLEAAAAAPNQTPENPAAELREHATAMLAHVRTALRNVSSGRATEQSSAAKPASEDAAR